MHMDKLRQQWNKVYNEFKGNRHSVWRENASPFFVKKIDFLKYQGLTSVLDAGCGDGRNLVEFAKAGFEVTGVDISDSALKKCKDYCREYQNAQLFRQDLENLDFDDNSFEVVICDFVMAHMEKSGLILQNFYKILKSKGYALIEFTSTKDPHCGEGNNIGENQFLQNGIYLRFYTLKEIEKLMNKFKILVIDSQYYTDPYHGPGYTRKKRHTHHSYFVLAQKA